MKVLQEIDIQCIDNEVVHCMLLSLLQFSNEVVQISQKVTVKCWHRTEEFGDILVAHKVIITSWFFALEELSFTWCSAQC